MKLSSVVLLTVNLVAISQTAAVAQKETASFLQESLSELASSSAARGGNAAQRSPVSATVKSIHYASAAGLGRVAGAARKSIPAAGRKSGSGRASLASDAGLKLRPFVPGRYLPSEKELEEAAYRSMAPKYDPAGFITGEISTCAAPCPAHLPRYEEAASPRPQARTQVQQLAEVAIQKVCAAMPRRAAGALPARGAAGAVSPPGMASFQEIMQPLSLCSAAPGGMVPEPKAPSGVAVPEPPLAGLASLPIMVPAPMLSRFDDRQLEKMMEANMPSRLYANKGVNGEMRGSVSGNPGLTGVGPPPFPLSFMPGAGHNPASMGAAAGRSSAAPMGSEARFGSWHDRMSLQQSSFQSYLPARMAGPMPPTRLARASGSRRTGKQAASAGLQVKTPALPQATHRASSARPKPKVASYPAYLRYSG